MKNVECGVKGERKRWDWEVGEGGKRWDWGVEKWVKGEKKVVERRGIDEVDKGLDEWRKN